MTYQILVGSGGFAGWNILKRTAEQQKQLLANDPVVARSTQYVRENIAKITSAEDLVSDYRMLSVALGAFGLESDVGSKAFIRKILGSDRDDTSSLVNRLSDKRYLRLANALALDDGNGTVSKAGFGDRLNQLFLEREFERRVGEGDQNLRLALNAQRELQQFANRTSSETTLWYEVMGNPPLRKVFDTAFGFGSNYGKLPIDRQLQEFTKRAEAVFGSSSFDVIATEKGIDKLVQTFLLRFQVAEGAGQSSYSIALSLLRRQ